MNYTIRVHVALVLHQQLHEMKHVIKGTTNAKKLMAFPFPFQNLPHKLQYNEKKKTNPLNDTNKKKKKGKMIVCSNCHSFMHYISVTIL